MKALTDLARRHPRLASWVALALGMTVFLLIAVRDQGMSGRQVASLVAITVAVAGVCAWIIGWEPE